MSNVQDEESALPWSTAAVLAGVDGTFEVTEGSVGFLPVKGVPGRLVILARTIDGVKLKSDNSLIICANDAVFEFRITVEDEENYAFVLVSALTQGLFTP